jgi:hypothetical protein
MPLRQRLHVPAGFFEVQRLEPHRVALLDDPQRPRPADCVSAWKSWTPIDTLSAVVAEGLGFDYDTALTLGRTVGGLNAYSKGVSLGLFEPCSEAVDERLKSEGRNHLACRFAATGRAGHARRAQERLARTDRSRRPASSTTWRASSATTLAPQCAQWSSWRSRCRPRK